MKTEKYTPEILNLWKTPESWYGTPWNGHYVFLGQNRDSGCLTRSNFRKGLEALGGKSDKVIVVRESHWVCGWIEWIAIHKTAAVALKIADKLAGALECYPVLDETDFSELETEEAENIWTNCYDNAKRIEYIRKNSSQFEFQGFADLLSCCRGKYFAGYASELIN